MTADTCVLCGHSGALRRGFCTSGGIHVSCRCLCEKVERTIAAWPHLLARVLYVPGVMAAVSRREWEEGFDAAPYSEPKHWPSWAIAP